MDIKILVGDICTFICHMVDYNLQSSRGDPVSAENHLSIYQYPNTHDDDDEAENAMLTALENACDQLYNNGVVGYYEISITYDYPYLGDANSTSGCDGTGLLDKFVDYLGSKNPPKGSHLLVTDHISYGCGKLGENGKTPFNGNWRACVMGTELAKQFWRNGGIHEVLHNYVDTTVISDILYKNHDKRGHRHHDLGKLYCDGYNETSPMCTSYENKHGEHGECADNCGFDQVYRDELTTCAVKAMDQTASYY